jgi:hypothetical protein
MDGRNTVFMRKVLWQYDINNSMSTENIFDFGFTAVDERELGAYQEAAQKAESASGEAVALQNKVDKLYNAILPLLSNLKKNPEKDYILWPQRLDKVEAFETYLQTIYKS